MFDPSLLHQGSEVGRDELGPAVGGDGVRHTPAGKQEGEEVGNHPGDDRPDRQHLRPFGMEVVGHQRKR